RWPTLHSPPGKRSASTTPPGSARKAGGRKRTTWHRRRRRSPVNPRPCSDLCSATAASAPSGSTRRQLATGIDSVPRFIVLPGGPVFYVTFGRSSPIAGSRLVGTTPQGGRPHHARHRRCPSGSRRGGRDAKTREPAAPGDRHRRLGRRAGLPPPALL